VIQIRSIFKRINFSKVLRWLGALVVLSLIFLVCLLSLVWMGAFGSLPDKEELRRIENPIASEIYSADSVLLGRYFVFERSMITFQKIPRHVVNAVLATEDIRFYKHRGIDRKSLGRVLVKSILLQQSSGGGSTLTQQLAKNIFPRKDYIFFSMVINKFREMIIASRLEDVYTKDDILTLYLNTVPFGDNTYGVEAAAQRFFSVPTQRLTIAQGAVLVGMLKANYAYNPRVFPSRSLKRRNTVIAQMAKYAMLKPADADSLQALPLQLQYNKISHHTGLATYFREYIRPEIDTWCKSHYRENEKPFNLYTDGLKIYTTLDSRLQKYGEQAMAKQMKTLQRKFDQHWSASKPWIKDPQILQDAIANSDRYKQLTKTGLGHEEIIKILKEVTLKNIFTWEGESEKMISAIDSIKHHLNFLQAGIVAVEPQTGAVRAWVGGIDHHYFQYDHVKLSTKRQVGSTFKPIVYAAALEQGAEPCDFISSEKMTYTNMEGWAPQNSNNNYSLKYSMAGALTHSVNTVSVKVLEKAGIENTIDLAQRMGISSTLPRVPSLALGAANVSMLEMAAAYSCFANDGASVELHYITSITSYDNKLLQSYARPKNKARVLSSATAQEMLYMLQRVVNEGTASGLRSQYGLTNAIAGKTGTTQSNADGWFMGITPKLVIGVWVGADDPRIRFRSTALGQGAKTALPIAGEFLSYISQEKEFESITRATFPPLSKSIERKLSCDLTKEDKNLLEKIFGKRESTTKKKKFGERKKTFLDRLFGK
jgi:penicillin-binding protein 1A